MSSLYITLRHVMERCPPGTAESPPLGSITVLPTTNHWRMTPPGAAMVSQRTPCRTCVIPLNDLYQLPKSMSGPGARHLFKASYHATTGLSVSGGSLFCCSRSLTSRQIAGWFRQVFPLVSQTSLQNSAMSST